MDSLSLSVCRRFCGQFQPNRNRWIERTLQRRGTGETGSVSLPNYRQILWFSIMHGLVVTTDLIVASTITLLLYRFHWYRAEAYNKRARKQHVEHGLDTQFHYRIRFLSAMCIITILFWMLMPKLCNLRNKFNGIIRSNLVFDMELLLWTLSTRSLIWFALALIQYCKLCAFNMYNTIQSHSVAGWWDFGFSTFGAAETGFNFAGVIESSLNSARRPPIKNSLSGMPLFEPIHWRILAKWIPNP